MNARAFVDAIRRVVVERAPADVGALLRNPPGRKPSAEVVELSRWHLSRSDADKAMIERLTASVPRDAVFGVFAVLDGARAIKDDGQPGDHFELRHVHTDGADILSGPSGALLHELL